MFKKIVWATDGSEAADRTLPLVKQLEAATGAELLVVHCEELMMAAKAGRVAVHADEDELKLKIKRQVSELSQGGVLVTLQMGTASAGGAAHVIADAAREQQAELIVVGTRGHTALAGLLLGSVTQRLLHIAPCPVLAVPTEDRDPSS